MTKCLSVSVSLDYRLNPVLRKACKADIPKFCQPILSKAMAGSELEGQVISCLKLKYADQVRHSFFCFGLGGGKNVGGMSGLVLF